MAMRAATAASRPCPRPSTTATRTLSAPSTGRTRWRSPDSRWPLRAVEAMPTSSRRLGMERRGMDTRWSSPLRAFKFAHRDGPAGTEAADDVELIHQMLGPGKTQPQPARGRIAVQQRPRDVGNSRAFVLGRDSDAGAGALADELERHLAAPGVHEDVAGDLRDRRGDDRLIAG